VQKCTELSTGALTIHTSFKAFFIRKAAKGHCQKEEFRPQILFENNLKNNLICYHFLHNNKDTKNAISSLKNLVQIYGGNSKLYTAANSFPHH
jgi:hypothetical protein